MGILDQVLEGLRGAGFRAEPAYPGRAFPHLAECAAAVHLHRADGAGVTVEVMILGPAALGGTRCELEALNAARILRQMGGSCVQSGCRYDGLARTYSVQLLAEFSQAADDAGGLRVLINGAQQRHAVAFTGEETPGCQAEYVMGENLPAGVCPGRHLWSICLEEKIPLGCPEEPEPEGEFEVKVVTEGKTETYSHCGWTSIRRELTGAGIRRVRQGMAMLRKEEVA